MHAGTPTTSRRLVYGIILIADANTCLQYDWFSCFRGAGGKPSLQSCVFLNPNLLTNIAGY